ncbi:MAG: FtsL-like putative cell division protein [Flavobacteriales bacterium]|jgi:cell division protein FtsL
MTENRYTSDEKPASESSKSGKSKKATAFSQILNGEFLTKDFVINNLSYILFLFFLLFVLVAKGYYGKSVLKEIQETRTEVDQNTAEYIEIKTMLEERTRRYKMVERLKKKELVESENAIKVIKSNEIVSSDE